MVFQTLVNDIVAAIPKIAAATIFLAITYVAIKVLLSVIKKALSARIKNQAVVNLKITVISIFLWFSAALSTLTILGLEDIAASLGTATGFIGLGVAYALKDMIADTVAGVYLLQPGRSS
jgi:small-conductance mechanosensitive channel